MYACVARLHAFCESFFFLFKISHLFLSKEICNYLIFPWNLFAGRVGCPHYIAPEVLTRRQYGKACDVWGAGVTLHVLLSGRLPFNGSGRRLQEAIARGRVTVCWWEIRNLNRERTLGRVFWFKLWMRELQAVKPNSLKIFKILKSILINLRTIK